MTAHILNYIILNGNQALPAGVPVRQGEAYFCQSKTYFDKITYIFDKITYTFRLYISTLLYIL